MFKPDDPLKPRDEAFEEGWHAQTLALADTMVKAGYFSATDWAKTLGAALKDADTKGEPDTTQTYYHCAIGALEQLVAKGTPIDAHMLNARKQAWAQAYQSTLHGQPVVLGRDKPGKP